MKSKIALYALVMLGTAVSAFAQDDADVAYQKTLLARPLSVEDKVFCAGLVGTGDAAALEACHVTRLFVIDINAGKDAKRYPPKARPKYAKDSTEKTQISDRM